MNKVMALTALLLFGGAPCWRVAEAATKKQVFSLADARKLKRFMKGVLQEKENYSINDLIQMDPVKGLLVRNVMRKCERINDYYWDLGFHVIGEGGSLDILNLFCGFATALKVSGTNDLSDEDKNRYLEMLTYFDEGEQEAACAADGEGEPDEAGSGTTKKELSSELRMAFIDKVRGLLSHLALSNESESLLKANTDLRSLHDNLYPSYEKAGFLEWSRTDGYTVKPRQGELIPLDQAILSLFKRLLGYINFTAEDAPAFSIQLVSDLNSIERIMGKELTTLSSPAKPSCWRPTRKHAILAAAAAALISAGIYYRKPIGARLKRWGCQARAWWHGEDYQDDGGDDLEERMGEGEFEPAADDF